MIGRLTGRVIEEEDGGTILDVNGVGYELVVPIGTIGRAKSDAEGRVTLFVHTHVREDIFSLFGFASEGDRLAFRTLIGVSSVGPKTAIAVLSALPAHELGQAIARKELAKLTSISGIGKKTAERLLLELKDTPSSANADVLARALVGMGYKPAEADRAIEQLGDKMDELPIADLVKEALSVLSK